MRLPRFFLVNQLKPNPKVNYVRLTKLSLSYKSSHGKLQRTCDLNPQSYDCWATSLLMPTAPRIRFVLRKNVNKFFSNKSNES